MSDPSPSPSDGDRGPIEGLRALASALAALLHTRAELAVVELRQEGERRKRMAVLAGVAAVFLTLAAGLFAFFVVLLFWESHRLLAAAGVTLLYLCIGAYAVMLLRRAARDAPAPFEATLAELAKDAQALRGRDG